jgi:hypothetical protein
MAMIYRTDSSFCGSPGLIKLAKNLKTRCKAVTPYCSSPNTVHNHTFVSYSPAKVHRKRLPGLRGSFSSLPLVGDVGAFLLSSVAFSSLPSPLFRYNINSDEHASMRSSSELVGGAHTYW